MPVALMIILVIASTTREGAKEGIQFYIGKFDASQLTKLDVWATACAQILFSLGPGFGTAITYSSFVSSKEDVYRAGIIVSAANSVFSIFSGFAVFATVGHLAYMEGVPVAEVATRSGTGLAFITFAEAMSFFGSAEVSSWLAAVSNCTCRLAAEPPSSLLVPLECYECSLLCYALHTRTGL